MIYRDGITFQQERFADCLEELKPLHAVHWQETEEDRHELGLDIDYPYYLKVEEMGMLHLVTARDGAQIIAEALFFVQPQRHSKGKLGAGLDSLYLLKEYRRGLIGLGLLRFTRETLMQRGVVSWTLPHKAAHDVGALFRRLGASLTEHVYTQHF